MARIRTIKPDFFTSEVVAGLPLRSRLTWIGLWTYCDDFGRCRANVKLVKAAVWALDEVSISDIEIDLNTLADRGLIFRYSVDGKDYIQVTNWKEHQRVSHPTESKIPDPPTGSGPPPGTGVEPEHSGLFPKDSGAARDMSGAVPPGSGKGSGREKERENTFALARGSTPSELDLFEDFWITYPRRIDKRAAERAWRAALKRGARPDAVLLAARQFAQAKVGSDPKFIKHPATWLNSGSYDNEPEKPHLRLASGDHRPYQDPEDQSVYDQPF